MNPTIGRIVLATIVTGNGSLVCRPAIVVRVWGDSPDAALNAQVFTDGDGGPHNDGLAEVVWKTSLAHDPTGTAVHSWRWPTEGPAPVVAA